MQPKPKKYSTQQGHRYPAGASPDGQGVNFSIFSRHASEVTLLLFKEAGSPEPFQVIKLNSKDNRTFFFWHVYVEQLPCSVCYAWQVAGPDSNNPGCRFNPSRHLLDPWAKGVDDSRWDRRNNLATDSEKNQTIRAMIAGGEKYDWQGDKTLNTPTEDLIIYEMHVGGFSRHPSARATAPGTFSAIVEKIDYLKELGINAVELMPVMAFDEQDIPDSGFEQGLKNYWGYATHSFFSLHPAYCASKNAEQQRREFRDMVKALHQAGISVILDVVYNHTAEGGATGPTINFKGLVNKGFYHLEGDDLSHYKNYSGCGNTVNCNHPFAANFILHSLEYWVKTFHIDGFRFDLASIFARGEDGAPMHHPPIVWNIEFSGILAQTKLIAEAWDAGGLYQVGGFPGLRWSEWNGRYRDLVRQFVGGKTGLIGEMATRLAGSSDMYEHSGHLPSTSINFITCHDGFTLNDLVSYNNKHNLANGEDNRDGDNHNHSFNCGIEGVTATRQILKLRRQQAKNLMAILMLSQGVPMLLSGDEILRSQQGNNNCYCQDNELSWIDWQLLQDNNDMFNFTREMIKFRKRHPCLRRSHFFSDNQQTDGSQNAGQFKDISWHGTELNKPHWSARDSQILACTIARTTADEEDLHIILNMSGKTIRAQLPQLKNSHWYRAVDTGKIEKNAFISVHCQRATRKKWISVAAHSVVVLENR